MKALNFSNGKFRVASLAMLKEEDVLNRPSAGHTQKPYSVDVMERAMQDDMEPLATLEGAGDTICKWPYDRAMCCGRPAERRKTYCGDHLRRVWIKPGLIGERYVQSLQKFF